MVVEDDPIAHSVTLVKRLTVSCSICHVHSVEMCDENHVVSSNCGATLVLLRAHGGLGTHKYNGMLTKVRRVNATRVAVDVLVYV